jgi:threonine/homoserine/homoserine lactone efflux protein
MSIELYLAFLGATALLFLTPGPAMSLVLANSAAHGTRAGLMTVAGNAVGFAGLLLVVIAGMSWIVEAMAQWFDLIRLAGAAYLVWLGLGRLLAKQDADSGLARPRKAHFREGMTVAVANPKVLLFLGAFLPPFVNPAGNVALQLWLLAGSFVALSLIFGAGLALAVASARSYLAGRGAVMVERLSGGVLIEAGLWLALARR